MSIHWQYPIHVVQYNGGYVSVLDPDATVESQQVLAVFDSEESAGTFILRFNILGAPRPLNNDREFAWLLQSLRSPVTSVAFEPDPKEASINSRWQAQVHELLSQHLSPDSSPWDYPVFVVAVEEGFASIRFPDDDGKMRTAIILFTSRERADRCIAECYEGTACELTDLPQAKTFLTAIGEVVDAVALNPEMEDGHLTSKHCFLLGTLLEKYFD